jgi:hypothetical protein
MTLTRLTEVDVEIDESGRHEQSLGIDYGMIFARNSAVSFNVGNSTVLDENIGSLGLCASAVNQRSAADKN